MTRDAGLETGGHAWSRPWAEETATSLKQVNSGRGTPSD
jgi:hypothetical protein